MVDATSETVRIAVLGPLTATGAGETLPLGGPKQQCVLALLIAASPAAVSADALAFGVYGDEAPERGRRRVQTYVSTLRSILGDVIHRSGDGWLIDAAQVSVDAHEFEDLVRSAAHRRAEDGSAVLAEALDLFRGTPYAGLEAHGNLDAEVARLDELRLHVLERRIDADLAAGRADALVGELNGLVRKYPYRESMRARQMLALYRSGRQEAALRSFTEQRDLLVEELGVDPSPQLTQLEAQILRQDESLLSDPEPEGEPLRGYRLLERFTQDDRSTVWRAVQPSVEREVAVRQIEKTRSSRPSFIRQFESQAQAIARLEHPHIDPLIDFWRDPNGAFLVTRWLSGGTLGHALDERTFTTESAMRIVRQVGEALSAAHRLGISHGRVHPSNVMLDDEDNAFLSAFGTDIDLVSVDAGPAGASAMRQDLAGLGDLARMCFSAGAESTELASARMANRDIPLSVVNAIASAVDLKNGSMPSLGDFLAVIEDAREGASEHPLVPLGDIDNPYRGLRAFEESDSVDFFGRNALVDEMLHQLAGDSAPSRTLIVVGPSGSGKSSAVHAGLLPAIRTGRVPGSESWFITTMVPGDDPFVALEEAFARISDILPTSLSAGSSTMRPLLDAVAEEHDVVLVVDQLEELFTSGAADHADEFLDLLADEVGRPNSRLRLIATLRADHYGAPLLHASFAPLLKTGALDVTPLTSEELVAVIADPAEQYGLTFDDGLVARIVGDANRQSAPLPLLQYTLAELFERRDNSRLTADAYDAVGGLAGAIGARAETIYLEASPDEQAAVRRLFARLVNPDRGAVDLRRRALLADFGDDAAVGKALTRYDTSRLLSFDRDATSREPTVEVAHEALLREWPRLANWLEEDQSLNRTVDRLAAAADAWHEGGRSSTDLYRSARLEDALQLQSDVPTRLRTVDQYFVTASRARADDERGVEQARVRRLRRLVALVGGALAIAIIAGVIAVMQGSRAREQATQASARGLAASATALADRDLDTALLLAANASALDSSLATDGGLLSVLNQAAHLEGFGALPDPNDVRIVRVGGGVSAVLYTNLGEIRSFRTDSDQPAGPTIDVGDVAIPALIDISDDGTIVAITEGGEVRAWQIESGQLLFDDVRVEVGPLPWLDFSPLGTYLFAGEMVSQQNTFVRLADGVELGSVQPNMPPEQLTLPSFASDEALFYWAGETEAFDGSSTLDVFSLPELNQVGESILLAFPATVVAPSPDGTLIAFAADSPLATVTLTDAETFNPISPPVQLDTDRVALTTWSPDSAWLAVSSVTGEVGVLSAETGGIETRLPGKAAQPQGAGWIDASRFVQYADGERVVWDVSQQSALAEPLREFDAFAADAQPSGRYMTSFGPLLTVTEADGTDRAIDHGGACGPVFAQPFGDLAIMLCLDPFVFAPSVVDLVSGEVLLPATELPDQGFFVIDAALSPDGSQFAAVGIGGSPGGFIATYDTTDGSRLSGPLMLDPWALVAVEWTPGGEYLLAGGQAGELLFVEPGTLEIVDRVETTLGTTITDISWGRSGDFVVTANEFGEVWLIDIDGRAAIGNPLTGAAGQLQSAAISPDGTRVAAIARDTLLRIWDRDTGTIVGSPLQGSGDTDVLPNLMVRFIDDDRLITWGDNFVTVWDLTPEGLRERACELVGRGLRSDEREAFAADLDELETSDVCNG